MKKTLLTLVAASTCAAMSAAVPTIYKSAPYSEKTIAIAQENPTYNNPVAVSPNGASYIAGSFDGQLTFNGKTYEADVTSAYVLRYINSQPSWSVTLQGAAQISAMACDADNNLYVAGTFADEVTFLSTSGDAITKTGLMLGGEATSQKSASFIAKYDSEGALQDVKTFIPEVLPALATYEEAFMYFPSGQDIYFHIQDIQVDGNKLYASATFTGKTTVGDVTLEGNYLNLWDMIFFDVQNSAIVSLDCATLSTSAIEMSAIASNSSSSVEAFGDESCNAGVIKFTVDNGNVYAAFIPTGMGYINVTNGTYSKTLQINNEKVNYTIVNNSTMAQLSKAANENASSYDAIGDILIANGTLYLVGSADTEIPGSGAKITGMSDIFVAAYSPAALSFKSVAPYSHDEGKSAINEEEKSNYELPTGAVMVNDALYINTNIYNFYQEFLNASSYLLDGTAYSAAPINATGIGLINGTDDNPWACIVLPLSDASQLAVQYGNFEQDAQSGIAGIANDNSNAPVEFYNLQGIRVDNPVQGGIYIRRQGNDVQKVLVK